MTQTPAARGGVSQWMASGLFTTVSVVIFTLGLSVLADVSSGQPLIWQMDWVPSLDISLAFRLDGLSLLFLLLISGTGAMVGLYAGRYLAGHPRIGRFFLYLGLFQLSMLGLVAADDLIALFVFWELTTLSSFLLIGFEHDKESARRNAWQALLVTGLGGLALLAGLLLLADAASSWRLSEITLMGESVRTHALYLPILALVLLGAFTKSAQFPFHFWLPNAMAAPTPVSAYLHSATMVKAGIYLLARLHPALGGTAEWMWTLTILGAVTALWASIQAVGQRDLKLALAYTTLMALGSLTMFLGSDAPVAVTAALTFLLVHALYKCGLFLVVGIIDHETGTRDVTRLGGLGKAMPITAAAAGIAALSMAGFPPFLGFIGKELKYEGALAVASEPAFVAGAAVAANALMVAVAGLVALAPFWGKPGPAAPAQAQVNTVHDPSWRMWAGPLVLALTGLGFGLAPGLVAAALIQPAATAVLGEPAQVKLVLWHGLTLPLGLSVVTLAAGVTLYALRRRVRAAVEGLAARLPSGDDLYDRSLYGILGGARALTGLLQNGSLHRYLFIVLATATLAGGGTLLLQGGLAWPGGVPDLPLKEWGLVAVVVAGGLLVVASRSRLVAICGMGLVGFGIAVIFLNYGAPDLAMTQLVVETLFVVMMAVIMLRLPRLPGRDHRTNWGVVRDGTVAVLAGATVTSLLLAVLDQPISPHITRFYEANSVPGGHGGNIVNVILVDFRALDTLGEIIVVAVAALAALALIAGRRKQGKDSP